MKPTGPVGCRFRAIAFALLLGAGVPGTVMGYVFTTQPPTVWPNGDVPMDLQFSGPSSALIDGSKSWKAVAESALATWNPFIYTIKLTTFPLSPGPRVSGDGMNQAFFSSTIYGQAFGQGVLAVTSSWRIGTNRTEADTVFNSALQWNSYRGPLRQAASGGTLYDLRRVAIHEFGHTLGLGHPDRAGQTVVAIMNSHISDLDTVAADDTYGASALYPGTAPAIASQPQSQTIAAGRPVTFSVVAYGAPVPTYRWYFNGAVITNATKPSYTISTVKSRNAGAYTVLVKNAFGSLFSREAVLTVAAPPSITTQPQSKVALVGGTATFSVAAAGSSPLSYQWYRNGLLLSNATSNSYTLASVQPTDAANYKVKVTNPFGTITSAVITLTVHYAPPVITVQPTSQTVVAGSNTAFQVTATGFALTYRWKFNGTNIAGATNSTLRISNARPANAGKYRVLVTNPGGTATSSVVTLKIVLPPSINAQPESKVVAVGTNVTFSVTASGAPPLSFQWYRNGASLPGATGANYAITSAQRSDAGAYNVRVSNAGGNIDSAVANLTIQAVSATPPMLTVSHVGNDIRLAWPASAAGFLLQESDLPSGNWANSSAVTSIEGDENITVIPAAGASRFYRLSKSQ